MKTLVKMDPVRWGLWVTVVIMGVLLFIATMPAQKHGVAIEVLEYIPFNGTKEEDVQRNADAFLKSEMAQAWDDCEKVVHIATAKDGTVVGRVIMIPRTKPFRSN